MLLKQVPWCVAASLCMLSVAYGATPTSQRPSLPSELARLIVDKSRTIEMEWCHPADEVPKSMLVFWSNGLLELENHKKQHVRYYLWSRTSDGHAIEIRFAFPGAKQDFIYKRRAALAYGYSVHEQGQAIIYPLEQVASTRSERLAYPLSPERVARINFGGEYYFPDACKWE